MTRLLSAFLAVITGIAALSVYQIAYDVMDMEEDVLKITAQISEEHDTIRIYKAEWSHLNDPRTLEQHTAQFLNLAPVVASQFMPVAELPLRPEPGDLPLTVFLDDGIPFSIPRQKPAFYQN